MCFKLWYTFCSRVNIFFEKVFYILGYLVASRPHLVLALVITPSLLIMVGFIRFYDLSRIDQLYIPQNSQAMQDLNRGNQYFTLKIRVEEFTLKWRSNDSAINDTLFQFAYDVHRSILGIHNLENVCFKDHRNNCVINSPLEMFNYNPNLKDVSKTINHIYTNSSILASNGRAANMNYPDFFGYLQINRSNGNVEAKSIRTKYFLKFPDDKDLYNAEMAWEGRFLKVMKTLKSAFHDKGVDLFYSAGRSINDSILESSESDIKLVSVSIILMIIFCTFTLAKFRDQVSGHFLLGMGGIGTLILGIGSAFGFVILMGNPYIGFAGVLPFLVLGVGIDNIFIITDCFDRQDPKLPVPERIATSLSRVGASITMTTVTDLVAFGVSTITDFPAIKYFCLYVALSITFCYTLVVTLFTALLAVDANRIQNGRKDFLPCMSWQNIDSKNADNNNNDDRKEDHESLTNKMMAIYGTHLMKLPIRVFVIMISVILLAVSCYASTHVDQSFDALDLGLDGSVYSDFYSHGVKGYPTSYQINIILDHPVNYARKDIQERYVNLSTIACQNQYIKNFTLNWMKEYLSWAEHKNKTTIGREFYKNLEEFLKENKQFLVDLNFDSSGKINASRIIVYSGDDDHSLVRRDEMVSLRKDLKSKTTLPVYAISLRFIYMEQFVIILRDTIRNLSISSAAILIITLPYLANPLVTLFVFLGFVSLIFELLGMMYVWHVSLNSISMIVIVMAIGFAVDYSAHVAHAFVVSNEATPTKCAIDALRTMGKSVLMGGSSTFVGILITAFASSEIFRIFFKMMFGIITLGLLHGLLFLPVLLATFCKPPHLEQKQLQTYRKSTVTPACSSKIQSSSL